MKKHKRRCFTNRHPKAIGRHDKEDPKKMNRHKEHRKEKKRRHDRWIQNAKEANKMLDLPNTLDNPPTTLFPTPRQLPTCTCQDDGARMLFYQVEETGNGYRIHIICVLCLQKGKQQIAWDPIGEEIVTYIFTRHFYQN